MSPTVTIRRILKYALIVLFVSGLVVLIGNQAVAFWHARQNRKGALVYGFALYRKALPSSSIGGTTQTDIAIPGSRVIEVYRHKIECEFIRDVRQRRWEDQRQKILKTKQKTRAIQLPVERYRCDLFPIYYRAGVGWGLF